MKLQAVEIIADYCQSASDIRKDYSGRGMMGGTTNGLVVDSQEDLFTAIADIMEECDYEERGIVADALRNMKFDSMGLAMIIY